MPAPWPEAEEESDAKRPRVSEVDIRSRVCRRSIQSAGGFCWSSSDLALAAKLLETPNARFPTITFSNMEEKRRVFTLVYDVLRYKSVLNQALSDVHFFTRYSYLKERCHLVWLLFLDLYKRDFTQRDPLDLDVEAAFHAQGLFEIDEVLWQLRVKLAATVSRLRIKSGAHSLSNLLPHHLQGTRSVLEENIISGWVNIFKSSLKETCNYLEDRGFEGLPREKEALEPLTYKTDHLLPRFLHIMPNMREDLVESSLLEDHHLVMQERTFCLGPAVMAQLLRNYALSGKVAQTHVNSPITMAYFANLLINNEKIESLLVFGAGYRKEACEQYLKELGVKNTLVFSENFSALSPESRVLDNVIAVLATPPNTNSSVVDPVDLAVARGGDLQILQQLTDDDFASTPRGDNIDNFLRDQRDTLRRGMSKPQIQFIVYETHSRFHCENEEMATNVVNELNNYAREVHLEELRRAQGETQERERTQAEANDSLTEVPTIKVDEELNLPLPSPTQTVQIPPSDLFEVADLPDLCPNMENCLDLEREGTYIAVIKRKEITRLDPKYMIQMAEARGLFGRPDATPKAKTSGQTARAKAALAALQARSDSFEKSKTKVKVEMDRIAAPTRASMLRDVHPPSAKDCPRFAHHLAHDGTPSYMFPENRPRKSFLTAEEEDELIRRLYICPRLNLFPPTLYEDLPTLKFWDSPASVIESYLQRRVFQKRLQMAYEFNQSKETHDQSLVYNTPAQLTKAVNQLTDDINYYNNLNRTHSFELIKLDGSVDYNKDLWNEVRPEEVITLPDENVTELEKEKESFIEPETTMRDSIRKRFSDYKSFYRLKHLKKNDKSPLALVMGKPHNAKEERSRTDTTGSRKKEKSGKSPFEGRKIRGQNVEFPELYSDGSLESLNAGKLPHFQSVSDSNLSDSARNIKKILKNALPVNDNRDSLLPQLPLGNIFTNFNRRGTLLSLRDSVELAHIRMSKVSELSLQSDFPDHPPPHLQMPTYKDSYMMLSNKLPKVHHESVIESSNISSDTVSHDINHDIMSLTSLKIGHRSTILGHQDSLELALHRITSREKLNDNEEEVCDICNNRKSKALHFLCDFHASVHATNKRIVESEMAKLSRVSYRDSVAIARKRISLKSSRKSVGCQVKEMNIMEGLSQGKGGLTKGGSKMNIQTEDSIKTTDVMKTSPTKLKNYLMGAVKINCVNNSSSKK